MRGFGWSPFGGDERRHHHHHHDHHSHDPHDPHDRVAAGRGRGGRGGHGGPFGWGPPGHPGFGGPGGPGGPLGDLARLFGRGRRARRGDVRGAILLVLGDEARNGYQIMQELAQRSGGSWRPSSGSVYPTLQQLEDEGLVEGSTRDAAGTTGKVYKLTPAGKRFVDKHRAELDAAWQDAGDPAGDPRFEMMNLFRQVGPALMQVLQSGSPTQIAEAKRMLDALRRRLYSMLAEAPASDEEDADGRE